MVDVSENPEPGIQPSSGSESTSDALEENEPVSGEFEPVQVHDLAPRRDKVVQELFPGILTSVHFRQSPELGVRRLEIYAGYSSHIPKLNSVKYGYR